MKLGSFVQQEDPSFPQEALCYIERGLRRRGRDIAGGRKVQAGRRKIAGIAAFAVLIASLVGLVLVLPGNADVHLSGEQLMAFAREHPPKPWHGFKIDVLNVSVDGEVHIKAHVSGNMIRTPIEISGTPEYKPEARAVFFRVSKVELPRESSRPMLGQLNAMLNPLGSYVAQNLTDFVPVKKIKPETRGGLMFVTTVRAVRVEGNAVVVELRGYRIAAAAIALMLLAFAATAGLLAAVRSAIRS
jgi:hypothetical protein